MVMVSLLRASVRPPALPGCPALILVGAGQPVARKLHGAERHRDDGELAELQPVQLLLLVRGVCLAHRAVGSAPRQHFSIK